MQKNDTPKIERAWKSGALLKSIIEAFEGLIYVSSNDYKIEYINAKLIKRRGHDIGKETCYKALHGRDAPCTFCVKDSVLEGKNIAFDIQDPRDQRWYLSVNTPVFRDSVPIAHLSMITDIHEKKLSEIHLRENAEKLRKENLLLRSNIKHRNKFGNIVGKSVPMQTIYEQILNAAATDAAVIIYGEPGTGKELVASAIHDLSDRRLKRFVPVHCGAIAENLIESEFFGHRRGAFSGAIEERRGYIEYADGGSLFLDEIGEISLPMQTKLLRVIEGSGYTPVGDTKLRKSNFRIIAATNRNLLDLIEQHKMREDFYYRIHILPIHLPPLRDRKEDLPLLIDHFLHLHGAKKNITPLSDEMIAKMLDYDWPGNVRELQNVIIRYCAVNQLELGGAGMRIPFISDPNHIKNSYEPGMPLQAQMETFEKQLVSEALSFNRWHRGKTSLSLGIDRKTLFNKMKRFGLLRAP
ncbi:MAG: sigma-54 dependent transcriptional regulator [Desulfobacterales bacterium]|nr:sigma-54 dependent transcriptional regulator [Desulfobacterales bacterium]